MPVLLVAWEAGWWTIPPDYNTRETPTDRPHRAHRKSALAVTCCALAIAACGSSSGSTSTTRSSELTLALKLASCMRSHGVPNFPDPTSDGQRATVGLVNKRSPAFRTAVQVCGSLRAELADFKPQPSRTVELRVAECMRAHGVTNYPDPLPGGGFRIPATIDPQSPTFVAAEHACEKP